MFVCVFSLLIDMSSERGGANINNIGSYDFVVVLYMSEACLYVLYCRGVTVYMSEACLYVLYCRGVTVCVSSI